MTPEDFLREVQRKHRVEIHLPSLVAQGIDISRLPQWLLDAANRQEAGRPPLTHWTDYDVLTDPVEAVVRSVGDLPDGLSTRIAGGCVASGGLWAHAIPIPDSREPGAWVIAVPDGLVELIRWGFALVCRRLEFTDGGSLRFGGDEPELLEDAGTLGRFFGSLEEVGILFTSDTEKTMEALAANERRRVICQGVVDPAVAFIVHHEIAHLVRGHHGALADTRDASWTGYQESVYGRGQEFEADAMAFVALMRTWSNPHLVYAGIQLFFRLWAFRESIWPVPSSHPSAYERIDRLAWFAKRRLPSVGIDVSNVAALEEPLSDRLRYLLMRMEATPRHVFSPWNDLLKRCAECPTSPPDADRQQVFYGEALTWLALGNPRNIALELGAMAADASRLGKSAKDPDDVSFFYNCGLLVNRLLAILLRASSRGGDIQRLANDARRRRLSEP